MSELFRLFFEYIKEQNIDDNIPLGKYIDLDEDGFKFELIRANSNSYSKRCTGVYENKVFSKFFDTEQNEERYSTELASVMQDTSQIRPFFRSVEKSVPDPEKHLKKQLKKLATYRSRKSDKYMINDNAIYEQKGKFISLIKFTKSNSLKESNFINTKLFTKSGVKFFNKLYNKYSNMKNERQDTKEIELKTMRLAVWLIFKLIKWCSTERIPGSAKLNDNEMKYDMLIELLAYSGDISGILKTQLTKDEEKKARETSVDGGRIESERQSLAVIKKKLRTLKGTTKNKRRMQHGGWNVKKYLKIWNELENIQPVLLNKIDSIWKEELKKLGFNPPPGPKELRKDLNSHTQGYWNTNWADSTKYQQILKRVDIWEKNSKGRLIGWEPFLKKTDGDKREFYTDILFKEKYNNKLGSDMESFKVRVAEELENLADPFFTNPIFNYYAREDFKRYVTLAMESWYIDQNISGILKKCSEISGLDYEDIVTDVVPWQYDKEKIPSVSQYVFGSSTVYTRTENQTKILKLYGISENDFNNYDVGENNKVSLVSTLEQIETYINKLIEPETVPKTINIKIIEHIQKTYNMEKLFPIDEFPQSIITINDNAETNHLSKFVGLVDEDQKGEVLKKWQKEKIDSVIGVLMDPYVNKPDASKISIQDYKMFYILANNSTQLKCYDQLKTFNMFSKFIRKIK